MFQYRRNLRTDDDPNYDGVAKLLRGEDDKMQEVHLTAGTLNIFQGRHTAHRVMPVEGDRQRVIAVFSYFEMEGVRFSEKEQAGFHGRVLQRP